jgi:thiol-disulfide isomerase/thioredoxin
MARSGSAPKRRNPRRPATRRPARRSRAPGWLVGALALAIAAAVGTMIVALSSGGTDRAARDADTEAASFDLPALTGQDRVRLADFRGQPVVVNFFASWCTTCDAELPDFHRTAERLEGQVTFVFVNSNETGDGTDMARHDRLFDFAVARDVGGTRDNGLYRSLGGPGGMPITAFYDAQGRVVDRWFGALLDTALDERLARLFNVPLTARADPLRAQR